jgi:outer membrane protein OmpA-like peptidoglycan-associated protein
MITALRIVLAIAAVAIPTATTASWLSDAEERLVEAYSDESPESDAPKVAVASAADENYCSANLKKVLRRVLYSCGLLGAEQGGERGCQPLEAKNVATMSGNDFNALFQPMKERGGIVQFEQGKAELDEADTQLVDEIFANQRGGSYFFVVSRASPDGSTEFNRALSQSRAEVVMSHLREKFNDPDLDKEVGLLWLGEEFAQLDDEFCDWRRSSEDTCESESLNRSAFIAWIDCRL